MKRTYTLLDMDQTKVDELDAGFYDYGIDDYVWFEDEYNVIVTDNPKVVNDLEQILAEADIEYTLEVEED